MAARVDHARAAAGLAEIRARQQQATAEALRSQRWFVVAVTGLVLAMNVAVDLLGQLNLLLVAYVLALTGLVLAAERQRRVKVHCSWYTPRRVALMAAAMAVLAAGMAAAAAGGKVLATWLVGEQGPRGLVVGMVQALVLLLAVPGMERLWLPVTRRGTR